MPRLPVLLSNVALIVAVGRGAKVTPFGVAGFGAGGGWGTTTLRGVSVAAIVGGSIAAGAVCPTLRGASASKVLGTGVVSLEAVGGGDASLEAAGDGRIRRGGAKNVWMAVSWMSASKWLFESGASGKFGEGCCKACTMS